MEKQILKKIKSYESIIIHRHTRPDLDAYGSQMGLKEVLKFNFPEKKIYVVGDASPYPFNTKMDEISDEIYKDSLVFVLDTSVKALVSDERYTLGKELIVVDHHLNDTDLNPDIFYKDSSVISCAELITRLAINNELILNQEASNHLISGIIGDSGRFMYIKPENGSHAFLMASEIMKQQPDIQKLYDFLYLEDLARRKVKSMFQSFELTENLVAYRINSKELVKQSGLDFQSVSRGMVNQMSGIKEVFIWASFTQDENDLYIAELRSRGISIVDLAKKYGGGGHANACGATLKSMDEVNLMIKDLNERAGERA
ncbi:DHH family phosphoesterase [Acholeplasma hippikon]|nr:bifunctional oligoribonuclease/PAP phosphatase NrnA [Acholeplasma hippikon]